MERQIKQVRFAPVKPKDTRVAVYARVSVEKEATIHSLVAQADYYKKYIARHPGWTLAGIYSDEAKTGTKDNREEFQRLLTDAKAGKIDMVITKSISRFARNTVTLLSTVRELKELGINVYFEDQNIDTMSAQGEVMITLIASIAQEESRSASENIKWRVKKNFEEGIPWGSYLLGYRFEDDHLVVIPDEAETVKLIFDLYLSGLGCGAIAKELNSAGHKTKKGNNFERKTVSIILRNYAYTGNLLLQRTYRKDHLSKSKIKNAGELPMYKATNTHEPIIDIDTFNRVRKEIAARKEKCTDKDTSSHYPLTSKVRCGLCGKNYRRVTTPTAKKWNCPTYINYGKSSCPAKAIPEDVLHGIAGIYGIDNIDNITAKPGNVLIIQLNDGTRKTHTWADRSRAESWTPEMKADARRKALCQEK